MKRFFDILLALGISLIFSLPALAITLILSTKGAPFYPSLRVGKNGKPFRCWKFRTMNTSAAEELKHLLEKNPEKKREWETTFKLLDDPRITPIGKFLRKTSLDELPQLWNVLKGDLSIVGPRPVTQEELLKFYGKASQTVLSIRPGITGLWQVSGRSLLSFEKRVELDLLYVETRSFILDSKIILKTIPLIFGSKEAF